MQDDLVERVAKHLCATQGGDWSASHLGETLSGEHPNDMREGFRDTARSIIPIVLEEAAKVADGHFPEGFDNAYRAAGGAIAHAIRAKMENLT